MPTTYTSDPTAFDLAAVFTVSQPNDGESITAASEGAEHQKEANAVEYLRRAQHMSVRMAVGALFASGGSSYICNDFGVTTTGATPPTIATVGTVTDYNGGTLQCAAPLSTNYTLASGGGLQYKSNLLALFDTYLAMSANGTNNMTISAGIMAAPTAATHFKGARFKKANGDINWQAETDDGTTTTTTDLSVTPSANVSKRLQILWQGGSVPGGLKAMFYINGVLKATHTTNLYTGTDAMGAVALLVASSNTANLMQVGRTSLVWNVA